MQRMAIAQSRLTAQGQISVPAAVRRKLAVGPGSTLEWHEEEDAFDQHSKLRAHVVSHGPFDRDVLPHRPCNDRELEVGSLMDEVGVLEYMGRTPG